MRKITDFFSIELVLTIGFLLLMFGAIMMLSWSKQAVHYKQTIYDDKGRVKGVVVKDSISCKFDYQVRCIVSGAVKSRPNID